MSARMRYTVESIRSQTEIGSRTVPVKEPTDTYRERYMAPTNPIRDMIRGIGAITAIHPAAVATPLPPSKFRNMENRCPKKADRATRLT